VGVANDPDNEERGREQGREEALAPAEDVKM